MEWVDDGGSRPAAWSYVPVQFYSCFLLVFYRTFVVLERTLIKPIYIIIIIIPSASWPLSSLSLFLFLRPCLIHARMADWGRAFVLGHTFLQSWSGPMTLVVGLLDGATFLSSFTLIFFVSFIGP